ncbi:MAG: phosphoglycolate phosphatase-like HAD superfamily hydrolase [Patescibacteria group bacterium]|jgi:phosphoglycolate phosphatase-like HAD superfamily hydrolase
MIDYIFLDFDGTLVDTRQISHDTFLAVLFELGITIDEKEYDALMGLKIEKIMKGLGIVESRHKEIREAYYSRLEKASRGKKIPLCCDIKPLIGLKEAGAKLVIVSNCELSVISSYIKKLGLMELFYRIYGTHKGKNKDVILKHLLREFGIAGRNCMYVGDRTTDVVHARKAGIRSVAISNSCSWSSRADLLFQEPDFLISDFLDLEKLIIG